ncbi:MAG: c-type cytochrome [Azoarcus sp.]|jgi:cytochrome c5|nr:c-type cytochrome [Azoarcus sp.]
MSLLRFPSVFVWIAAIAPLVGCEQENTINPEESAALTRPVAMFDIERASGDTSGGTSGAAPSGNRTGEEVYKSVCTTCHATGAAGAPTTGDAAAWAPRIATGYDALVQSVINGKGAMAPRGGAVNLTDAEARRGVAWLANQAGAQFAEPSVDAEPPTTAEPPVDAVPPTNTEPPVDAIPPTNTEPPVNAVPPTNTEPPVNAVPSTNTGSPVNAVSPTNTGSPAE